MNDQLLYNSCPTGDIAAYIDGELSPDHESELDLHFADCSVCTYEMNQQKHPQNGDGTHDVLRKLSG